MSIIQDVHNPRVIIKSVLFSGEVDLSDILKFVDKIVCHIRTAILDSEKKTTVMALLSVMYPLHVALKFQAKNYSLFFHFRYKFIITNLFP